MKSWSILFMLLSGLVISGCTKKEPPVNQSSEDKIMMANPASANCVDKGGIKKIQVDRKGDAYALCVFDDGSSCEEWELFRGECERGQSLNRYNWKF